MNKTNVCVVYEPVMKIVAQELQQILNEQNCEVTLKKKESRGLAMPNPYSLKFMLRELFFIYDDETITIFDNNITE